MKETGALLAVMLLAGFAAIAQAPKFTDGVVGLQIHTGAGVRMPWRDIFIQEK